MIWLILPNTNYCKSEFITNHLIVATKTFENSNVKISLQVTAKRSLSVWLD